MIIWWPDHIKSDSSSNKERGSINKNQTEIAELRNILIEIKIHQSSLIVDLKWQKKRINNLKIDWYRDHVSLKTQKEEWINMNRGSEI